MVSTLWPVYPLAIRKFSAIVMRLSKNARGVGRATPQTGARKARVMTRQNPLAKFHALIMPTSAAITPDESALWAPTWLKQCKRRSSLLSISNDWLHA